MIAIRRERLSRGEVAVAARIAVLTASGFRSLVSSSPRSLAGRTAFYLPARDLLPAPHWAMHVQAAFCRAMMKRTSTSCRAFRPISGSAPALGLKSWLGSVHAIRC